MGIKYISFIIVVIIVALPLIGGLITSKLFNKVHGIITYLFLNYIFYYFFNELLGTKMFLSEEQLQLIINTLYVPYNVIYQGILTIPNIYKIFAPKEKFIILTIVVISFIISQVTSSVINKLSN